MRRGRNRQFKPATGYRTRYRRGCNERAEQAEIFGRIQPRQYRIAGKVEQLRQDGARKKRKKLARKLSAVHGITAYALPAVTPESLLGEG